MNKEPEVEFSIVIPTFNRANHLRRTLTSLSQISTAKSWEVVIADNNSTDDTREAVLAAADDFPVNLCYVFERLQGRCAALNTGILAASGRIILTTDDDVVVEPDWLDNALQALDRLGCHYVCGRVSPIWDGVRPSWIPSQPDKLWAVVALLDYGPEPLELGQRYVPLGVNMAFRRECFDRAGLWDNRLGRKKGSLLGQEVREWTLRARAAGLRGFYSPDLLVHHLVPHERLNKKYFRRWFYWHGISRALLYEQTGRDMEAPESNDLDFSKVAHLARVPRYLYRTCLKSAFEMTRAELKRDHARAFQNELWLWFFAGIVRQRWRHLV